MKHYYEEKLAYRINIFEKNNKTLEETLSNITSEQQTIIEASIVQFRRSFNIAVRVLEIILFEEYGVELTFQESAIRDAVIRKLIDDEKLWLAMLDDKNLFIEFESTTIDDLHARIKNHYSPVLKKTMLLLKEKFGS